MHPIIKLLVIIFISIDNRIIFSINQWPAWLNRSENNWVEKWPIAVLQTSTRPVE